MKYTASMRNLDGNLDVVMSRGDIASNLDIPPQRKGFGSSISGGEIMYIDDLEKAALKLRTFADRIKTSSRGYSSMFEAVKINEDELDKLLAYDNALLEMSDEIGRAIDHVQASIGTEGVQAAIRNLTQASQKCIDAYNRRDEVVLA